MKKIFSILCVCSFLFTAHATLRMPDITVTKITQLGVISNVGFKVKDSNEWLKQDAEGKWTVTSTDTPVQGAIGDKDYSGFFFQPENSYSSGSGTPYYHFTYTLADINDPANGIVVDPETPGGTLLAPQLGAPSVASTDYFLIEASNSPTTMYALIYNGKVYGTSDKTKATMFEAYQLANANHNVSCVQTALPATCTEGGHNAVYQCSICQKYFKQQTCEVETTISDEMVDALGHDYLVVKDEDGKATWTWAEDKSSASLQVVCTRDASHNDNQNVATTANLSVTDATGFKLTYSATVTYNSTEYKDEKEVSLEDAPASVTVATAPTYTRTMVNKWGTLVVPFALNVDQEALHDFYTISAYNSTDNELQLTKVKTSPLAAGTPVLVCMSESAKADGRYTLALTASTNSVSTTINNPEAVGGLTLTGSYALEEITNKEGFIIGNNAFWNIQAVKGENKVYNAPFRAYLESSAPSGVKQLNLKWGDDQTTGIEVVNALTSDEAELFDLGGHRLTTLQKGVNIVKRGGKSFKVIIK